MSVQKVISDLNWVLTSPGLLPCPVLSTQIQTTSLGEYVDQNFKPKRLGKYFEVLLSFGLLQQSFVSELKMNLPVRSHKKTLGEFDFLFFDLVRKTWVHWEVAVKFYLYAGETDRTDLYSFYGPMGIDQLHLKLERTFQHQLKISETIEGKNVLSELGIQSVIPETFWKGMLFYPALSDWKNFNSPNGISSNHLRGWWCRSDQMRSLKWSSDLNFVFLQKRDWLGKVSSSNFLECRVFSWEEICQWCEGHFLISKNSLMVVEVKKDSFGVWHEQDRGIVVHPQWRNLIA